jgi:hypothetical protein
MKTTILLATFLFIAIISKAQCDATAGSDVQIECGDTAFLNASLYLTKEISNTGSSLGALYFIDHDHGFAAGGSGTIVKTTDGGTTW